MTLLKWLLDKDDQMCMPTGRTVGLRTKPRRSHRWSQVATGGLPRVCLSRQAKFSPPASGWPRASDAKAENLQLQRCRGMLGDRSPKAVGHIHTFSEPTFCKPLVHLQRQ